MVEEQLTFRRRVLATFGATDAVADELLAYNANRFQHPAGPLPSRFPLDPEPCAVDWQAYAVEAAQRGAWEVLRGRLVQLRFPIQEGISQTEPYRAVTRRGVPPDEVPEATGLVLSAPDRLRLWLHPSLAGPLPVLCTPERDDFVRLVQALGYRNEPEPIPAGQGACLVAGLNNWDRIRQHRQRWQAAVGPDPAATWDREFPSLLAHKELYQDRLVILGEGPYSNVSAVEVGLPEEEWRRLSLVIRLEHESTHYFTLRLFSWMGTHLLDELIADYAGIVAACGRYRSDWFLRFLGLENFPRYRVGGRLENYWGQPVLSDAAFGVLQALVKSAAENLERLDARRFSEPPGVEALARRLAALSRGTLEELASEEAETLLAEWESGTE
jgi:hypothetical protein